MSSENLNNLSMKDLKKLVNEEYNQNKKLRQEKKEELIRVYKKLQKQNEKLRQEKSKPKAKPKLKIKTFDEYFHECIKNKSIPKDTPEYFKKALERAMKEYDNGISSCSVIVRVSVVLKRTVGDSD